MVEAFIFSASRIYRFSRHLAYWSVWILLFTFIYGTKGSLSDPTYYLGLNRSYWITFIQTIPQVAVLALTTYTIVFFLVPKYYPNQKWFPLIIGLLLSLFSAAILEMINFAYLHPIIDNWFGEPKSIPHPIMVFASTNILKHGSAVIGFASAILLFKKWWEERERNNQLQKKNLSIKLKMLQQQLHPHFLFNTLNNLYGLILEKSDRAGEVVVKLSELLSYMLYDCKASFNPLKKELEVLKSYILLEQLRVEDRLDLSLTITGDTSGKKVAPLILLPFLENSFKHGVSDNLENPWINIEIQLKDDYLFMHLINSKTKSKKFKNGGIGLQNAKKRLELIYGDKYELVISETSDAYCINLKIPILIEEGPTKESIEKEQIIPKFSESGK